MFAPTSSLFFFINFLFVLIGVGVWLFVFLYGQFASEYPIDYIWEAIKREKHKGFSFIACVILTYCLVGALFASPFILVSLRYIYEKMTGSALGTLPRFVPALLAGILIAATPKVGESALAELVTLQLGSKSKAIKTAIRLLLRLVGWLSIISFQFIGEKVQTVLQQDNIDWNDQRENTIWYKNLTRQQAGRIVRIVFEHYKVEIARKRKDPTFLDYAIYRFPGDKFYLLAKYLGRNKLREILFNPPTIDNWDGPERRKNNDPHNPGRRIGDDPEMRKRIKEGK